MGVSFSKSHVQTGPKTAVVRPHSNEMARPRPDTPSTALAVIVRANAYADTRRTVYGLLGLTALLLMSSVPRNKTSPTAMAANTPTGRANSAGDAIRFNGAQRLAETIQLIGFIAHLFGVRVDSHFGEGATQHLPPSPERRPRVSCAAIEPPSEATDMALSVPRASARSETADAAPGGLRIAASQTPQAPDLDDADWQRRYWEELQRPSASVAASTEQAPDLNATEWQRRYQEALDRPAVPVAASPVQGPDPTDAEWQRRYLEALQNPHSEVLAAPEPTPAAPGGPKAA